MPYTICGQRRCAQKTGERGYRKGKEGDTKKMKGGMKVRRGVGGKVGRSFQEMGIIRKKGGGSRNHGSARNTPRVCAETGFLGLSGVGKAPCQVLGGG